MHVVYNNAFSRAGARFLVKSIRIPERMIDQSQSEPIKRSLKIEKFTPLREHPVPPRAKAAVSSALVPVSFVSVLQPNLLKAQTGRGGLIHRAIDYQSSHRGQCKTIVAVQRVREEFEILRRPYTTVHSNAGRNSRARVCGTGLSGVLRSTHTSAGHLSFTRRDTGGFVGVQKFRRTRSAVRASRHAKGVARDEAFPRASTREIKSRCFKGHFIVRTLPREHGMLASWRRAVE